ncbi:hypothetical protein BVRB_1g000910 [Beta vulgaris subsp. vulgaris]|nr:hypothetical protein BVRB_1g000910 [Beta vulgaris subsp. vulgaris]
MKVIMMKLLFMMLFLLLNSSVVFSELSSTQKSTMINLFELIQKNPYYIRGYYQRWNVSTDPCTWDGVTCSSVTNSVTQLYLSEFGVSNSSFLSVVCQIDTLEVLDVSGNYLYSIPDEFFTNCGKLSRLKSIHFSGNYLGGPLPSFNNKGFTKLEFLDFSDNSLSGSIGARLNGLVGLKSLNLMSNRFSGSIPSNLFTKLKELEVLRLSANNLQGRIPEQLANCNNLSIIDLSNNRLVGTIPDKLFTNCSKISRLKSVDFTYNNITGPLASFNTGFTFTKLESLDLSYNSLSGSIGARLNGLVGLKSLNLTSNRFSGSIPSNLFTRMKELEVLRLSANNLQGRIPEQLANCNNLSIIYLSYNRLVGTIPNDLMSLSNLQIFDLSYNRLVGKIPNELLLLRSLQKIDLSHNRLVGTLLNDSLSLPNLEIVVLSYNRLVGTIPNDLMSLPNLEIVDLSYNRLVGSIPGNVSSTLVSLRLTSNSLNGSILGINFDELQNLNSLELENNKLTGTIPTNLGLCHSLKVLNLARNQFTGKLPTELGVLDVWVTNKNTELISGLDLSHNNLSGQIPQKLQEYGYEAFAGNLQLCGPPISINCGTVEVEGDMPNMRTSIFTVGFYVSMGLGFYFGFWGVCGSLYLKDAWRHAFFNFLDTIYNKIYVTIAIYVARYRRHSQT